MIQKILIIGGHIEKNGAKITAPWDKNLVITEGGQNIEGADELVDAIHKIWSSKTCGISFNVYTCPHDLDVSGEIDWVNKNSDKDAIIISIHHNAFGDTNVSGVETFYKDKDLRGKELAERIAKKMSEKTGLRNRGAKEESKSQYKNLGIISGVIGISVLVECGFLTNPIDREIILNPNKDNLFSEAIAEALAEYLQIKECPTCNTLKISNPTPDGDEICPNCGDREMGDYEPETMQTQPESMQKSYSDYLDEAIEHEEKALELMKKIRNVIIK